MPDTQHNIYLLLDAALCGLELIEAAQEICEGFNESLYILTDSNMHLSVIAPYIFQMDEPLQRWYLSNVFGKAWGIVIISKSNFEQIRAHFRKFLKVKNEEGKQLYFRFYDPRVLKIFLPTCDEEQLTNFFGPVNNFLLENDQEESVGYYLENGILQQIKIGKSKLFLNELLITK